MKTIQLHELHLRNFKGIRDLVITFDGNTDIFGGNATGKTTTFDGFMWLLFDKDSNNKKDFDIKTIDDNGSVQHGLEHEVEAILYVNNQKIQLKKIYKEKWTKRRGAAKAEFTGHTTDYFINEVPSKKKEFESKVQEIVDENVFKLLTNPAYFNTQLNKKERRDLLLEIAGNVTDQEVLDKNKELRELESILDGRSIEEHKKVIAAKRKEINKELDRIPIRIDEIGRSMPDLSELDKEKLEQKINQVDSGIDGRQSEISEIRNGNALLDKKAEIQKVDLELSDIKRNHESDSKDEIYKYRAKVQEETSNMALLQRDQQTIKQQINHNEDNIKSMNQHLSGLRDEWKQIDEEEFTHNDQCECPTCGQSLPEEQLTEAREKALSDFKMKKSQKLEEINAKGKRGKEQKNELESENNKLQVKVEKLQLQIDEKASSIEKYNTKLEQLTDQEVDITENQDYIAKLEEKKNLNDEMNQLKESADESIQKLQLEISALKKDRELLQAELSNFALVDKSKARIKELESEQERLGEEFEQLEKELYLTEEFTRTKVDLLEEKINSKFEYARFNLFKQNINGGLEEVCDTTYKGVPYASGLNNAAKINIGLDIINTLSKHYEVEAPIFIDNAESVTKLIDTNAQIISLIVSENDSQLRVEKLEKASVA
ncbi:AAA family ATPase [Oceanobacillus kimchii]|uniref:AAA family ATPase n=1 Tax=Oceanobacillus kimchii TaxID=746691 RepID=UPI0021A5C2B2|nr:AAA family ATPase [Oceanobacillus kimchii]MCT1577977.1 AAA family ATPase [Oceanobacillus kimchii]MCT2137537.1 AAA family ATPase [Oceanobacillus kimchii]